MVPLAKGIGGDLWGLWRSPSRSVCHSSECQASSLHLTDSRSDSVEAGCVSTSLRPSLGLCLPSICTASTVTVESASFDRPLVGSGGAVVATERVVRLSFVSVGRQTTLISTDVELAGSASRAEVPRPRDPPPSCVKVIQRDVSSER